MRENVSQIPPQIPQVLTAGELREHLPEYVPVLQRELEDVALSYVKNEQDAEDVVQEVWERVLRWLAQQPPEQKVFIRAFLTRAVQNRSVDCWRRRQTILMTSLESFQADGSGEYECTMVQKTHPREYLTGDDPADEACRAADHGRLHDDLMRVLRAVLSPDEYALLLPLLTGEQRIVDRARELDCSAWMLKSLLFRRRLTMRRMLCQWDPRPARRWTKKGGQK